MYLINKTIDRIITFLLLICAIFIAGIVVNTIVEFDDMLYSKNRQGSSKNSNGTDIWNELKSNGTYIGNLHSSVKMIVFYDYQCPYSKNMNSIIESVRRVYKKRLSVMYRHLPLSSHMSSYTSAIASECSDRFGKFIEFHNELFDNQGRLNKLPFDSLAYEVGIRDVSKFSRCIASKRTAEDVLNDKRDAIKYDIKSTPTVIIGDKIITGVVPRDTLIHYVESLL